MWYMYTLEFGMEMVKSVKDLEAELIVKIGKNPGLFYIEEPVE